MSIVSGVLTFGLPDSNFNKLLIYSGVAENSTFILNTTVDYNYPEQSYEYGNINEEAWYKIKFLDTISNKTTSLSDAVIGSGILRAKPFLVLNTTYDGASYNSAQDLYDYTNLTEADASTTKVDKALRKARAYIDLKVGDTTYNRFTNAYIGNIARRKYNATLELVKECELNLATSIIFKNMSDDQMMNQIRGTTTSFGSVSIGQTSVTENSSKNPIEIANFLMAQASKYALEAAAVLNALVPSTVPLMYDNLRYNFLNMPRFLYPWNI